MKHPYLEVHQETIKPLFAVASVKEMATGVQESADQSNSEQVVWRIVWGRVVGWRAERCEERQRGVKSTDSST